MLHSLELSKERGHDTRGVRKVQGPGLFFVFDRKFTARLEGGDPNLPAQSQKTS